MQRISKHVPPYSTALIFIILFWLSYSAHADTQLIVNGGFETGDFTGWSQPPNNPNPWSVVSFNPYQGSYAAYTPAESTAIAETTLNQSITPTLVNNITSAGFWYYDQGANTKTAVVLTFSNGDSPTDLYDSPPFAESAWTYFNLEPFLLNYPGEYLVQIGFFPVVGESQEIDDVSITATAVPEPSCLTGFGILGITGLWGWKNRKQYECIPVVGEWIRNELPPAD